MNPDLALLHPYPFEKLADLKAGVVPPPELAHIALSIGEPKHTPPSFVLDALVNELPRLSNYPATRGIPELREAIASWLQQRFKLAPSSISPEHQVLPVNGTREALFAFAQASIDRSKDPVVMMNNPFYQIYEGAALLAGAQAVYLNCEKENGYLPDLRLVPDDTWARTQLLYLCTPNNPCGSTFKQAQFNEIFALSEKFNFIIASDECYSEIYPDEANPPLGLLQAAQAYGLADFSRCIVFHSLSKRSNLPGLRSGFVAGDSHIIGDFLKYRTYHGCAMSVPNQLASIAAWNDESHVHSNRDAYREKFATVSTILAPHLDFDSPEAAFYLWPRTPISDTEFARRLYAHSNVTVLPGSFLGRDSNGTNPGSNHVRMALVASIDECRMAAERIAHFVQTL